MNKTKNYNKIIFNIILIILIILIIYLIILFIKYNYQINNFINTNNDNLIHNNNNDNNNTYTLPKIIWVFWDKEELPKNISLIINNNKNKLGNEWIINVLNDNNIKNYLDINTFPNNYINLEIQHKADYLRLKLLEKYGGIWMDASIIINSKDEFEKMFRDTLDDKIELTAFTLYEKDNLYKYHQYIENWFLIAPQNSNIIKLWLKEFETAINMGFVEYKKYITEQLNVRLFWKIENSNCYLTMHTTLQVVLQNKLTNNYIPNLLLLKSEDNMFKLYSDCTWNNDCIKKEFENNIEIKNIPYIKLTSSGSGLDMEKYFS